MNKILECNLDKDYTEFVMQHVNLFAKVHPNYLTVTGLAFDFVILWAIFNQWLLLVAIALFIRYSCDCLDGAVARKYNRVSDLGGILDTAADSTLIFVLVFSIAFLLSSEYAIIYGIIITSLNLLYLLVHKSIIHHHNVKKGGNLIQNIYTLGVNNNCVIYSVAFLIIAVLI